MAEAVRVPRVAAIVVATVLVLIGGVAATAAVLGRSATASRVGHLDWEALGDSYSAGTGGTGLFESALYALPGSPTCAQSQSAYSIQAASKIWSRVDHFELAACAGAQTSDIWRDQLPHVNSSTNVVTLTAGGNDIKFADTLRDCITTGCPPWMDSEDQQPPLAEHQGRDAAGTAWDVVFGRLVGLYEQLRKQSASDGDVYVLSYPLPFGDPDNFRGRCSLMTGQDAVNADRLTSRLDDTIYQATSAANQRLERDGLPGNIHFVDWRNGVVRPVAALGGSSELVSPTGLCGDPGQQWWINPVHTTYPNLFHPTSTGYWAAASRLLGAMGFTAGDPPFTPETLGAIPTIPDSTFPTLTTVTTLAPTSPPTEGPASVPGTLPNSPASNVPGPPDSLAPPLTTHAPAAPPHRVDAYNNYGDGAVGHAMCRGNPGNGLSMPGGVVSQSFTVGAGVSSIDTATVQIDPDSAVTAHASLAVNGGVRATSDAYAVGDTVFSFSQVPVGPGDVIRLTISFTATYGKIITVYSVGNPGGELEISNSCPDGAPSLATGTTGLRAVLAGWS